MNKEHAKRFVKNCIPWRLRYFVKLQEAKGNIRFSDSIKQRRGLGEYNDTFYEALKNLKLKDFEGKTVCELGPGQHLSHAFLEYQLGAEKEILLEIDDFAHVDSPAVPQKPGLEHDYAALRELPDFKSGVSWRSYLEQINATYSISGLKGYRSIPDNSVDYCLSFAVLEHIRKDIFTETIQETYRFMRYGGVAYHTVDFTDHMGGGKNQLRFPESVWEDEDHYKMDNYTNRISCSEMCRVFQRTGFKVLNMKKRKFKRVPVDRKFIYEGLREISEDDLLTAKAVITVKKVRNCYKKDRHTRMEEFLYEQKGK